MRQPVVASMRTQHTVISLVIAVLVFGAAASAHGKPNLDIWTSPAGFTMLYESDDIDRLLLGALVAPKHISSPHSAEDFYRKALNKSSDDKLILYSLMVHCAFAARTARPQVCSEGYLDALKAIDAENGAVWAALAAMSYGNGDKRAALARMKRASEALYYETYETSYLALFDRALPLQGLTTPRQHLKRVFALLAGLPNSFMYRPCKVESSDEWTDACLLLGQKMEDMGRTLLTIQVGLDLQARSLRRRGYSYGLKTARERYQAARALGRSFADPWLYFADDHVFWRQYLETYMANGEAAAMELLTQRVEGRVHMEPSEVVSKGKTAPSTPAD